MEAAYLEGIVFNIDEAANLEQLEEIREELKLQGYLKTNKKGQKQKTDKSGGITEPLQFISSDGLPILVGRNNTQNDYLTLRVAKNNDVWLHAKDIPGSHVIIKNQFKEIIPDSTLEEAAILAAYFSKGRNSNNVPIDYTTKKNVHKPNNAKPGLVIYDNYKTVYVKPDRQRIDKLKSKNFLLTN
jgi:predicted ribosome quality control (RQC) complex YloA/Tae2 family protein